ncbi:EamA family transporter [Comamonas aquatica]|jgi:drug/metabolite transporter (DMT)-like permease|uniref:Phosphonate utilization associated putative membrane protein n=1 Tax=Comamonas aquatica TaxID=225991 RepID=A0AA35GHX2_9BURK|nr:EamA family transporter [Comamonas aquatica]CAB5643863.1 phosphonate utilization associated putative membrane protein [Comamonas aquatica]CAB5685681.1 phosphonate utilization associated putative membrane protein [Comamonas aquatica]CAC9176005.1 phosphonate utilization associated putative membrane protein [Comamonas aquatica]CAC9679624.1 phosphonate utilization associated putative membrane protein [Comamonas aquatica]
MSLQAFALILLAGLIHAGWNIAAKKAGGDARFAFFSSLLLVLVWAPLAWWVGHDVVPHWGWQPWALVAVSGVLHLAYYVILLRGYRQADLTVVYPLARGSGPLISSLFAIVVLGEEISQLGLLGVAGVVLGVFLIAGGPGLLRARQDPVARLRLHQGLLYGLLTGVFIAAYTVVDGYGVKVLLLSPILIDYLGSCLRVLLLSPVVLRNLPEARVLWMVQWRWALLVAVVSPVAYVLVLFAMQSAPISHVAPAREVSMLFAALIGGHLLREGDRLVRMVGAVLIAMGVTALGLG